LVCFSINRLRISSKSAVEAPRSQTPLEIVVRLVDECYFGVRWFSLKKIVQQLIEAGADVADHGSTNQIPLEIFFDEVCIA